MVVLQNSEEFPKVWDEKDLAVGFLLMVYFKPSNIGTGWVTRKKRSLDLCAENSKIPKSFWLKLLPSKRSAV